jgi:hypothetical protein
VSSLAAAPTALALDAAGNIHVTGSAGADFPTTPGVVQPGNQGGTDAFLLKLSADGSRALYATLLGGSSQEQGRGTAVDTAGQVYPTGDTASSNFPVTSGAAQTRLQSVNFPVTAGAFQTRYEGSPNQEPDPAGDAFAAKFGPQGALVWSTYLGGKARDAAAATTLDAAGNTYIAGRPSRPIFPRQPGRSPIVTLRGVRLSSQLDPRARVCSVPPASRVSTPIRPTPGARWDFRGACRRYVVTGFFSHSGAAQKTYGGGDADAFAVRLDLASPRGLEVACALHAASFHRATRDSFPTARLHLVRSSAFSALR